MKKQIYFNQMNDRDLLSMVCDSEPQANEVLKMADRQLSNVGRLTIEDLCQVPGIGEAKAGKILAVVEIARRMKYEAKKPKAKIRCSQDAWKLLESETNLSDLDHEEFWAMYCDRSNQVLKIVRISEGGISGTVTDIRIILNHAVKLLASGLIVAHNHPSGNLSASEADIKITGKLKESCKLLDITMLDHIILSDAGYMSMADDNLIP
jgi:DNA repair protein RadC